MRTLLKRLIWDEDAQEIIEFQIAALCLFMLILGIMEFGLGIYADCYTAYAAEQGARYAMVRGGDWTTGNCSTVTAWGCNATVTSVQNYVLSLPHPGLNNANLIITPTWLTTTASGTACSQFSQGCQVKVTVTYPFTFLIPSAVTTINLTTSAQETIQD